MIVSQKDELQERLTNALKEVSHKAAIKKIMFNAKCFLQLEGSKISELGKRPDVGTFDK